MAVRLDWLLVKRGLVASRQRARELIVSGQVLVDGIPKNRPATQVDPSRNISLKTSDHEWASRGALKILGFMEPLDIDIEEKVCADFGASTGGFTHVLLSKGAKKVYAVDVGKGLLDWKLRKDERVVVMEGVNIRYLEALPEPIDFLVADLSFISLKLILPSIKAVLRRNGHCILLVKPQFEVGRKAVGKNGTVRSPEVRQEAIDMIQAFAESLGFHVLRGADSTVPGAKSGNIEYFIYLGLTPDMDPE